MLRITCIPEGRFLTEGDAGSYYSEPCNINNSLVIDRSIVFIKYTGDQISIPLGKRIVSGLRSDKVVSLSALMHWPKHNFKSIRDYTKFVQLSEQVLEVNSRKKAEKVIKDFINNNDNKYIREEFDIIKWPAQTL